MHKLYFKNTLIEAMFDLAYIIFLEEDEIRFQILEAIFIVLSSPVA